MNRMMEYLAMSKHEGDTPLETILAREELLWDNRSALVVITPSPRQEWAMALGELAGRGVRLGVVLMNAASFGGAYETSANLDQLSRLGIHTYEISKGDDISAALNRRPSRHSGASREADTNVAASA